METAVNVLILVLSSRVSPYHELNDGQRMTWDSVSVDGVRTEYYFCETWDTYTPYRAALDEALSTDWTHLFRTNASSYVDKKSLVSFCESMPKHGCNCGIAGNVNGLVYASGSGAIFSRDAAKVIRAALDGKILHPGYHEDVFAGEALAAAGMPLTPGARRCNYWDDGYVAGHYHYRCRFDYDNGRKRRDVEAFKDIHSRIHGV